MQVDVVALETVANHVPAVVRWVVLETAAEVAVAPLANVSSLRFVVNTSCLSHLMGGFFRRKIK